MTQRSRKRRKIRRDILCQPKAPKNATNKEKVKRSLATPRTTEKPLKRQSLHNTIHFSSIAFSPEALCKLQEQARQSKEAARNADCNREKEHSVTVPQSMPKVPRKAPPRAEVTICPIDNMPEFVTAGDIIDKPGMLEVYRLRNRTEYLEQIIKIQNRKIEQALEILAAEIHYYRTGLKTDVWETYDGLQRRLHKLESQLQSLLDSTTGPVVSETIKKLGKLIVILAVTAIFGFVSATPDGVTAPDRLPTFEIIEDKKWRNYVS